jgi:hypothetical protein
MRVILERLLVVGSEVVHRKGDPEELKSNQSASIDANSKVGCVKECHVQCNP